MSTQDLMRRIGQVEHMIVKLHTRCCFGCGKSGVHPGQAPILGMLSARNGCSQAELAREYGISGASVNVSVRRMEKAGLLEKMTDELDTRVTRLKLTERGRREAAQAEKLMEQMVDVKFAGFSDAELETYYGFEERICKNLEQFKGKEDKA